MEARIARLEALAEKAQSQLQVIDKDLAVMRAETKAHIAEAKNTIIVWVVAAVFLAQLLPMAILAEPQPPGKKCLTSPVADMKALTPTRIADFKS